MTAAITPPSHGSATGATFSSWQPEGRRADRVHAVSACSSRSPAAAADALLFGTLGIGLAASRAAAINHVLDSPFRPADGGTMRRPIPTGHVTAPQPLAYAGLLGVLAMLVLWVLVNPLTAVLTFASLIGYAVLYTVCSSTRRRRTS